jgi:hypothetical protein
MLARSRFLVPGILFVTVCGCASSASDSTGEGADDGVDSSDAEALAARARLKSVLGVFGVDGQWRFDRNRNGRLDAAKYTFGYASDVPLVGDWTGDGKPKIGVFRSLADGSAQFYLDMDGDFRWSWSTDKVCNFGLAGDRPVVGDWTGDGTTKVGVFRSANGTGQFGLDMDGDCVWNGRVDRNVYYGFGTDTPIAGDWTGNGRAKIGVFRAEGGGHGAFYLDWNGNFGWDGDDATHGKDAAAWFGFGTDVPVVGDWRGTGESRIGVVRPDPSTGALTWSIDLDGNRSWNGSRDVYFTLGPRGAHPLVLDRP